MNRYFQWAIVALVAVFLTGCEFFNKKTEPFSQVALHGLWQEEGTQHFVRYLEQKADTATATYEWGKEWDVAQKVTEDRLVDYGNGWFKYELKYVDNQNKLTQINKMDNDGADIYERYIVTVLSDSHLEYYKEGYPKEKQYYNKVIE